MSRIKRRIFIISGIVLIAAGCVLTAYNVSEDYRASSASADILSKMDEQRQALSSNSEAENTDSSENSPDVLESESDESFVDPDTPMPTVEVDGYQYIGTLVLPPLEIELPVADNWDYTRMKISPCRYSGSFYSDDLVICAHNYSSHFRDIGSMQVGDVIIFIDVLGNEFHYKVGLVETLGSTAVDEMTSSEWDLSLFTCNYSGMARVTVRCERVDE